MYEYDAQIFRSLIRHKDFKGRSKRIICDSDENMGVPQKIAEGIYLEMNSGDRQFQLCRIPAGFNGIESVEQSANCDGIQTMCSVGKGDASISFHKNR